jgi:hypothetical protein
MNIPLTKHQLDSIRRRVREGMEDIRQADSPNTKVARG